MTALDRHFGITAAGSRMHTELLAGLTTFLTMAYILFVQPFCWRDRLPAALSPSKNLAPGSGHGATVGTGPYKVRQAQEAGSRP